MTDSNLTPEKNISPIEEMKPVLKNDVPEVKEDISGRVEKISTLEQPETSDTTFQKVETPYVPKKPNALLSAFSGKIAPTQRSTDPTPAQKVGGGLLGAGIVGGGTFGILQLLANARYWSWVPDIIAGPLATASGVLSPLSVVLIAGGAVAGLIWGAKKLWKVFRKRN